MQSQQHPAPASGPGPGTGSGTPRSVRQRHSDVNLLSHSVKRHSLHINASTPQPGSPGVQSPRLPPRSPSIPPNALRRSSSVASLNRAPSRASSPALARKSSSSSLRSDTTGSPLAISSRRASFVPNMPSPMGAKHPLPPPLEEKLPLRACDVAEDYFKRELARHEDVDSAVHAGTIVIVHDQCYGHRFSRPKTPKGVLSTIMERPERILASVKGISAAYVHLGERHCEGSNPPHPDVGLPTRIPFKIRKTSRLVDITSPVVTNVHGTKWMAELKSLCDNAGRKLASTGKELSRDAPAIPGQKPKTELHTGDLYLCPESLNAFQGALGGVLDAVDAVFENTATGNGPSRAFVCIRPPGHHCSADFPSGFCWLNNVHVGIEHAMMNYGLTHAAIIDFDLHHGDGSQTITWARNKKVQNMPKNTPSWKKSSIGYFSLHDINSYPCEDGDDDKVQAASLCIENAHGQSIWNVHLQSWKTPEEFWDIYEEKYLVLLEKARQYLKFHTSRLQNSPKDPAPKAAIFLSAGFDASEWETAGMQRHSVNVPTEFYARFTRDVVLLAQEEGTAVDGRVISVLEGGYSDRALTSGVLSHLSGLCDGQVWTNEKSSKGLSADMHHRLNGLSMHDEDIAMQSVETESMPITYDTHWWHPDKLFMLENPGELPPVPAMPKPPPGPLAHFSSPTQSFTAKVVDPTKLRSMSSRHTITPGRAVTPPPPEVDWATAAHALSKLLIPSDRQTRSFKPEELSEPKIKKEKPAAQTLPSVRVEPSGRQLRGRKPATSYVEPGLDDNKTGLRADSRAGRRQTIADFGPTTEEPPAAARSTSRRMSIASSVSSMRDRSLSRAPSAAASRRSVGPGPTTSNGVAVKKSRGAATAGPSRTTERPPVPRIPSNFTGKTTMPKEKENDDMDALTSGLKRVTLKMPSREEYEAREKEKMEKQQAFEASKKLSTKTTARKTPAARTTAPKPASKPNAAKRGPGRPPKSSRPPSPVEMHISTPVPESPRLQSAATLPLEQPQPMSPSQTSPLVERSQALFPSAPFPADRRGSLGALIQPPSEMGEMVATAEQLRERLPKSSFVTVTDLLPTIVSPPRADSPPAPPPSTIPQFVHYTSQTFGASPTESQPPTSLQWLPPNTEEAPVSVAGRRPMSPAKKREDLPVFSANGMIPFAPNFSTGTTNMGAASASSAVHQGAHTVVKTEEDETLWEVPETPPY
ncbi:Arginase/deacetylase [Dothidotthia symphoricarpi CBS 119687]|uniref:Arginase/deacetylase n=1 Tax=Dothidotthia symphoricarpi CBS 119687 TaxID=1392245 RepID=A0A6A6A3Q3_9PLEO|nr:Arginase/deacetylase [Dothidotthia symphoricarpi CBS 119687]KAF2125211.1 Arginase/deacetylase [Dothidotthia symphoricarpi CBS 119687]